MERTNTDMYNKKKDRISETFAVNSTAWIEDQL